jgi:hypothetical protein
MLAVLHFPFSTQVMEHFLFGHFVVLELALTLFLYLFKSGA